MKVKKELKTSASEVIILTQSMLLLAFGLAAWSASDTLLACMNVFKDPKVMVAFVDNDRIITEAGDIGTTTAEATINNFELICLSTITIASLIAVASLVRLAKKGGFRNG